MKDYLRGVLNDGGVALGRIIGNTDNHVGEVPLYVMATAGMRDDAGVPVPGAKATMHLAWDAIHQLRGNVTNGMLYGHGATAGGTNVPDNIKSKHSFVVRQEEEGVYAWVALNHGRYQPDQMPGIIELGGKSMQIAYTDPTNISKRKGYFGQPVCLFKSRHRLTTHSWVLGLEESSYAALERKLISAAPPTGDIYNPCLPHHVHIKIYRSATDHVGRNSIGSGDFAKCLAFAQAYLETQPGGLDIHPLTSLDIEPYTKRFYGVSNFWYNYEFFALGGVYDINSPYDPKLFRKAVEQYCNGSWLQPLPWNEGGIRSDKYIHKRCFGAAWMISLFHGHKGFHLHLSEYEAWKSLIRFPSTPDLADRSSWTIGAATMVARNGHPQKYCSDAEATGEYPRQHGGSLVEPAYDGTSTGVLETTEELQKELDGMEKTVVVAPTSSFVVETAQPVRAPSTISAVSGSILSNHPLYALNPASTFSEGLVCGFLLIALVLFGYRRFSSRRVAVQVPVSDEKHAVDVIEHRNFFDKAKGTIFLAGEDNISRV